ncbi:MAG TPA: aromatic-ring-hydroxylating dioxygenase subunit beta [Stellaceae bacterium]|nr:aromatic-ring-hydroxylating dioxygenase subunit beta [Stellaceae bacterium]
MTLDIATSRALRLEIEEFNAEYCAVLDEDRLPEWPDFFTEDAVYRITARENADAGLPVGLVYCEGAGMLKDRVFALLNTAMYAPRTLLHHVSNTRILDVTDGLVTARATYLVLQTLVDEKTTIHQAGRYFDVFARVDGRLRLKQRDCVYDTTLIDNSLVLPV